MKNTVSASAVIRASNLSASYNANIIWENACFRIQRGEFIGILGPNGAGKTTLFRLLLGLAKPSSGNLEIFGEAPRRGNARIGYVAQRHPIDSELRIEALELVRLGIKSERWGFALPQLAKDERARAMQALQTVDA